MRRYPMLDGLRLLAAALVLLSHVAFWTGAAGTDLSGPMLARGDSGVAVFFAISAFLLLRPFLDRPVDLHRYAVHRAARILPAYYLALVAVLAVLYARTGSLGSTTDVVSHLLLTQGYTGADYQAFSQTWSLTTEVTFYLLVPVLGPALGRMLLRAPGRAFAGLAGIGVLGLLAQAVAAATTSAGVSGWPGVLATSVLGHALWFCVGAAGAALACPAGRDWALRRAPLLHAVNAAQLACGAVGVFLLMSLPWAGPVDLSAPTVPQAVVKELFYGLFAAALLGAATRPPGDAAAAAAHRLPVLRTAGDLSYAIFLWHVLVLQLLYLVAGWPLFSGGFGWMLFAVVTVTGLVAHFSTVSIERPALARWASRPVAADTEVPQPAARG